MITSRAKSHLPADHLTQANCIEIKPEFEKDQEQRKYLPDCFRIHVNSTDCSTSRTVCLQKQDNLFKIPHSIVEPQE